MINKRKQRRSNIAIIIPATNEEFVIEATLTALLVYMSRKNVHVVVNNRSKDRTYKIAKKLLSAKNVINLGKVGGKATALNTGIKKFKLTKKYDYIMPVDADTVPAASFYDNIMEIFYQDKKNRISAVIGKVVGKNSSWITAYRLWEYELSQAIYKSAQNILGTIAV